MRTIRRTDGATTSFVIADLDPAYHDAARALVYGEVQDGFAKSYPSDTPHLDQIYANFERYAEEMVLQTAGVRTVPWEKGLLNFLELTKEADANWWIAGSAALAVRGLDITPRDFDLAVDVAGARRWGELLLDYLVEPVLPTGGWFCELWGRAFLHARIEWTGGIDLNSDHPYVTTFVQSAIGRLETITWNGYTVRIAPLDAQLKIDEIRGLDDRVAKIKRALVER